MSKPLILAGQKFVESAIAAGVVPANCKRLIIEAETGNVVKVFFECYGDERLLGVDLTALLTVEGPKENG